jgi:hypothetical protein
VLAGAMLLERLTESAVIVSVVIHGVSVTTLMAWYTGESTFRERDEQCPQLN